MSVLLWNGIKMKKETSLIGITIVFIIMAIKLTHLTIEAISINDYFLILFIVIIAFWLISFFVNYKTIIKAPKGKMDKKDHLFDFLAILSGALIVYCLSSDLQLNSVIVVGILAVFSGLLIKRFANEIILGAFIGAGTFLSSGYLGVIVASSIAAGVYFLLKEVFKGLGGKLGTSAFIGGIITYLIFNEVIVKGHSYSGINVFYVIIISLLAGVLTYILNNEFKLGPITSYGIVLLLGSVFLLFSYTKDFNFANIVFGAALVGMTDKSKQRGYFIAIVASLLFGIFIAIGESFLNIGGRGGLLMLMSVLTASGMLEVKSKFVSLFKAN